MSTKNTPPIIPAILAHSKQEFCEKYGFIQEHTSTKTLIHIDEMDGKFVPNTCWCTPQKVQNLHIKHPFEVHLMTCNPERRIQSWRRAGAERIHFHIETTKKPLELINKIHAERMQAGVALNITTPLRQIELIAPYADAILVMGIIPGDTGKRLHKTVFSKIRTLRKKTLRARILVDGGVAQINAHKLLNSGAHSLISTSMFYPKELLKKYRSKNI